MSLVEKFYQTDKWTPHQSEMIKSYLTRNVKEKGISLIILDYCEQIRFYTMIDRFESNKGNLELSNPHLLNIELIRYYLSHPVYHTNVKRNMCTLCREFGSHYPFVKEFEKYLDFQEVGYSLSSYMLYGFLSTHGVKFEHIEKSKVDNFMKIAEVCKHSDVFWNAVIRYIQLPTELFEDIWEYVSTSSWWHISTYWRLSEDFIERFANLIEWSALLEYQKLSLQFVRKHMDRFPSEIEIGEDGVVTLTRYNFAESSG